MPDGKIHSCDETCPCCAACYLTTGQSICRVTCEHGLEDALVEIREVCEDGVIVTIEHAIAVLRAQVETLTAEHVKHEHCIEEIQANELLMAERENELHDEKDARIVVLTRERDEACRERDGWLAERSVFVRKLEVAEAALAEAQRLFGDECAVRTLAQHDLAEARAENANLRNVVRGDEEQLKRVVDQNAALRDALIAEHQGRDLDRQAERTATQALLDALELIKADAYPGTVAQTAEIALAAYASRQPDAAGAQGGGK